MLAKRFAQIFLGASDLVSNIPICPSDQGDWAAICIFRVHHRPQRLSVFAQFRLVSDTVSETFRGALGRRSTRGVTPWVH